jgi:hypothetical protein
MSAEDNKRLAAQFFARFSTGDVDGALAYLAEEATWKLPGRPELMPVAGVHDKPRIARILHGMARRMKDGLRMTVTGMTAEDDRVAVELTGHGELQNGRVYQNEYHILMVFRDGKIATVREYLDTQHTWATWYAP